MVKATTIQVLKSSVSESSQEFNSRYVQFNVGILDFSSCTVAKPESKKNKTKTWSKKVRITNGN